MVSGDPQVLFCNSLCVALLYVGPGPLCTTAHRSFISALFAIEQGPSKTSHNSSGAVEVILRARHVSRTGHDAPPLDRPGSSGTQYCFTTSSAPKSLLQSWARMSQGPISAPISHASRRYRVSQSLSAQTAYSEALLLLWLAQSKSSLATGSSASCLVFCRKDQSIISSGPPRCSLRGWNHAVVEDQVHRACRILLCLWGFMTRRMAGKHWKVRRRV